MHAKYLVKTQTQIAMAGKMPFKAGKRKVQGQSLLCVDGGIIEEWMTHELIECLDPVTSPSIGSSTGSSIGTATWRVSELGRANLRRYLGKSTAAQHQLLVVGEGPDHEPVTMNYAYSALDWLRRHRNGTYVINDLDYRAARRLQKDFDALGRGAHLTMSWQARSDGGSKAPSDHDRGHVAAMAAQRRIHDALTFVGPGLGDVLVAVCQQNMSLQTIERDLSFPARSGKVIVKLALARLTVFYGFQTEAAAAASLRMR